MIDKFLFVYLAHPFTGNTTENVRRTTRIAELIIESSQNGLFPYFYAPLVPHQVLSFYNEETRPDIRSVTEAVSSALVRACGELWVVSPILSAGMKMEIGVAEDAGIPVREWADIVKILPEIVEGV